MRGFVVGLACLLVLGGLSVGGATAPNADSSIRGESDPARTKKCFDSTLKGSYGVHFEGESLGRGPFVSVSRITFDGHGEFTTREIGRFNGALVERTFTGPYSVNEDCTGVLDFTSTLSNPPHEVRGELVIVDGGREFFVLDNEDGVVASGVGKRI